MAMPLAIEGRRIYFRRRCGRHLEHHVASGASAVVVSRPDEEEAQGRMKISIALLQTESDRPSLLPTTVRRRLYVGLVSSLDIIYINVMFS